MALLVGVVAGFGAVGFRYLIYFFTWLATGHIQPLDGAGASDTLPFLGRWFYLLIPVIGGAIYGPVIFRMAREARGHGVPEVMIAVAENGGRIRPQVSFVKAFASALCIGTGGSVGREGPIVQIGSSLASTFGQWVRMSETRLRIIVACGAAGGIAATFNAPLTGTFFGFELILRSFSIEALFAIFVSAVAANVVSQQFFGTEPFFSGFPHDLMIHHVYTYGLVIVLGVIAGLIGVGMKSVLYKVEDLCDAGWKNRPEWARPAIGGLLLGGVLIALPQMYGVGYPVMDNVVGHPARFALWFVIALAAGKIFTAGLTIGIGGSGGVFAPSLFTGAMAGTAFGLIAHSVLGSVVGPPALYGMVAMGAVFAAAAQAPLTSLASVVEMTGDFALTLPVMLAVGIATAVSKKLTHGTIYTTKLLRRGTDIERVTPASVLEQLTVGDAMQHLPTFVASHPALSATDGEPDLTDRPAPDAPSPWPPLAGPVLRSRAPQSLFTDELLQQALRQLVLYGRDGLPVISADRRRLCGWITNRNVLDAINTRLQATAAEAEQGEQAAQFAASDGGGEHSPPTPLHGYSILEITITQDATAAGRTVGEVDWPPDSIVVATTHRGRSSAAQESTQLLPGDRITVLVATSTASEEGAQEPAVHA
ncbi:MAG: chloride channel protein [Marmoricola sp.]